MSTEGPRQPILTQQFTGQKAPQGFAWSHHYIMDWDHVWWEEIVGPLGFERWKRQNPRRNLLLTSASGSSKLDSSSQATAEENTE
jgi:hypothetical protein